MPLTHTLRTLFAVLAAALAFAGAGAGRGARDAGASGPELRQRAEPASYALPSYARLLARGGGLPLLDGPPRGTGAPPRMAAGTDPSHDHSFAVRAVVRRAAGARSRGVRTLALARRMAAARDGTLSARSTGVPPPVSA